MPAPPARDLLDTQILLRLSGLGRFFNMGFEKVPKDFSRPVSDRLKMFFIGLLAGWVVAAEVTDTSDSAEVSVKHAGRESIVVYAAGS